MSKVSRNDLFLRSERGPSWFDEFLTSMANSEPSSVQDILSAINNKRSETVESVVAQYREQVGLDTIDNNEDATIKTASVQEPRKLSIRHAGLGPSSSILPKIKNNKAILQAIDSFCEHSGGTKDTTSIINHLRALLGDDSVSYADQELKDYIEERKKHFHDGESDNNYEVGLVGQEKASDYDDDIADYQTYNGVK